MTPRPESLNFQNRRCGSRQMSASYIATINSLASAIEARDFYTRGHSERVTSYSVWLAEYMGLPRKKITMLHYCCRLHDVGKIGISDKVLLKPGRLSAEERAQIEMHPVYGAEILGELDFVREGMPVILHHHERFDGKGYPYGLKKQQIPIEVRIISVADSFDAMSSDRPYRKALAFETVKEELRRNAGTQFDPRVVHVFLKLIDAINGNEIKKRMAA